MREIISPKIRKKEGLVALCVALAIMSQFPVAASSAEVCRQDELGLWTNKAPLNLKTSIRLRMETPNWPVFVLHFQANDTDKHKLFFEKGGDDIKVKGLGVSPSVDHLPLSAIQHGQETILSFAVRDKGAVLLVRNGDEVQDIELLRMDLDLIDSVMINSNADSRVRSRTIVSICGPDTSESDLSSFKPAVSCPEPPPCPKPAPLPLSLPCPKIKPCPPFPVTSRPCPIPSPCQPVTNTFKDKPCPDPTPCPIEPCPSSVQNPPSVPAPTRNFHHQVKNNVKPISSVQEETDNIHVQLYGAINIDTVYEGKTNAIIDSFNNEISATESPNHTRLNKGMFESLLDDDPKNMIVYGLAASALLFFITTIALAIALYKAKTGQN